MRMLPRLQTSPADRNIVYCMQVDLALGESIEMGLKKMKREDVVKKMTSILKTKEHIT
jgi:hypothetical protein